MLGKASLLPLFKAVTMGQLALAQTVQEIIDGLADEALLRALELDRCKPDAASLLVIEPNRCLVPGGRGMASQFSQFFRCGWGLRSHVRPGGLDRRFRHFGVRGEDSPDLGDGRGLRFAFPGE